MSRRFSLCLGALTGVLLTGLCGCSFEELTFKRKTDPPAAVVVSWDRIEIPEGIAIGVGIGTDPAEDKDNKYELKLSSTNAAVFGFDQVPNAGERVYVFYGAAQGTAALHVVVDDETKRDIPVTITAQP